MVWIINQDREQHHKQNLKQAAYDAKLQTHFSSSFIVEMEWVTPVDEGRGKTESGAVMSR